MGQLMKTNVCNWDCINKEKEEESTIHYPIHKANHSFISSSKQLNSIPILFPKIKKKTGRYHSDDDEEEDISCNISNMNSYKKSNKDINYNKENKDNDKDNSSVHNDKMHMPISSDVSGILLQQELNHNNSINNNINNNNGCYNQKSDNTSNMNNSNTVTKVNTRTKTINIKSKEFGDNNGVMDKSQLMSKDIYNPAYIQAVFKGKEFRRKFKGIKSTLKIKSEAIDNSLLTSYDKKEFKYVEGYAPHPYTHNGYTKEEELKDYLPFNLLGVLIKNKTLVCQYNGSNALYNGCLNIYNEKHGLGILYTSSGEKYQGHWINNHFSGWGRLIEIKDEKSVTEGIFYNGKVNGFGKKYWSDKKYKGDFKDGVIEGNGIEESNVYRYEGRYVNGNKHGKGKIVYLETHDVYEGNFNENCLTGFGYYIWNNKHTYLGEFSNGNMHGKGRYEWPEGGYYEGEYKDNIKEGVGVFKWPDGKVYTGPFKNGQPDGVGKIVSKNKEIDVEFKAGKIVNSNKKKK